MGRAINNPRKGNIRVKINKEGYKKLVQFADTVVLRLTGNASFATPSPTLVAVTAAADDLRAAATFMGLKRNRGSKAEKLDAQEKATTVRSLLTALLKYVIDTALVASGADTPAFTAMIATTGFSMADVRSLNPHAQIARYVSQNNNKLHPGSELRLKWRKPLGLIKGGKVAGYNIYLKDGGVWVIKQTTTKTNTIIPNPGGLPVAIDCMIVPFNSRGSGNPFFATVKTLG